MHIHYASDAYKQLIRGGEASKFVTDYVAYRAEGNKARMKSQIARINRKLAKRDEKLLTSRGGQPFSDVGDHYVPWSIRSNAVVIHLDLAELEAELAIDDEAAFEAFEKIEEISDPLAGALANLEAQFPGIIKSIRESNSRTLWYEIKDAGRIGLHLPAILRDARKLAKEEQAA